MKIGLSIFSTDKSIQPTALGRAAEEFGFESLWFPDHSHIPVSRRTPFLGRADADPLPEQYWRAHDPLIALTAVAAETESLRVCTGVCLVAQRDPLQLAKQVASLDVISSGRVIFGIGYGWNREEMAHHGVQYGDRRDMVREKVLAMKALWAEDEASFDGEHVSFEPSWAWPKPLQDPHPPVVLGGGLGPKNLAHIVEFCDGWLPSYRFNDVVANLPRLREEAERVGRDYASIEVSVSAAPDDEQVLSDLEEAGVARVVFPLPSDSESTVLEVMRRYARLLERFV